MKPERAIERLELHNDWGFTEETTNAINEGIAALEKQVPRKPVAPLTLGSVGSCSLCSASQIVKRNYCYHCGQKFEWDD